MTNIPSLSNKRIRVIIILLSMVLFNSCGIIQNLPGQHLSNTKFHEKTEGQLLAISEKKEVKASASVAFINRKEEFYDTNVYIPRSIPAYKRTKISIFAGYGFHKHIAIQCNFMYFNARDSRERNDYFLQTLSAGYFYKKSYVKIKKGKTLNKSIVFDAYLGGGYGETRHNYYGDIQRSGSLKINFMRGFIHGGFRYDSGRLLKIGLAIKYSYTDYLVINKFSEIPLSEEFEIRKLTDQDAFFKLDLSPKIGIGNDYINVYVTSTLSSSITREFILNTFIGTEFNFTQWFKKRRERKQNKIL